MQDSYNGKFVNHSINYYLIAGLAYGLDNVPKRDFKGVYDIMWRYENLKKVQSGVAATDEVMKTSKVNAFKSGIRMFKGTDMKTPGAVYLKELAYFQGQESAWSVLAEVRNQDDLDLLYAVKLDLTLSDQLDVAKDIVQTLRTSAM